MCWEEQQKHFLNSSLTLIEASFLKIHPDFVFNSFIHVIDLNSKDNNSIAKQMFLMSQGSAFDCPNFCSGRLQTIY